VRQQQRITRSAKEEQSKNVQQKQNQKQDKKRHKK
jgi:hypothetical protein